MLKIQPINSQTKWIRVHQPDDQDRQSLINDFEVTTEMLNYAIDPDERARVESDEAAKITLLIFDVFVADMNSSKPQTAPVGIMFTADNLITFTNDQTIFVTDLISQQLERTDHDLEEIETVDLILPVLYQLSTAYFAPIRSADKQRLNIQRSLEKRTERSAIASFMNLETGLVYIVTSLNTDAALLQELRRRSSNLSQSQLELLDDVIIEAKQGLEMAQTTSDIIERVSNAYSKVLDSNLNNTMRFLTIYSIVLTVPASVFGFFGQNVHLPFSTSPVGWELTLVVTLVLVIIASFLLWGSIFRRK
ncbi:CorA-like Mg2+ transporter protein [Paucilactobacillus hokkaidonensis JCM 18461]|uniref:CorA-like Mg2+ transporter protein n=2 Tax=Paucilactobacillus hokkaidonensis TaxID=1193095 RepID=A0A0A1H181_9LACO|nr:magnesium transporter CorA family protein [Paucilactobacillus hokkaidonensis]KRO11156.1 MIT family Mg2+ and Co2+ transporter [Paucilactobacillus hokkaidonensis]BAP86481.1 CorA-like Mg2+ transporter protein [Paucilactobacillus hokkaidonensis JCM 18461]